MRLGLVVSVKRYDDEDVVDLKNTADDASKLRGFIAEALPKGRRFDVKYLSDPTASDVYLALKSIKKKLLEAEKKAKKEGRQEKHLFLFFFGGHGYARPDGTQYLLCSDAVNVERSNSMIGGIEPVVLQEFAEGLESTDVVFWIDACRGQVFRQKGDERYSLDKFRTVYDVPSGEAPSSARRLTINACDHNQYAADDGSSFVSRGGSWDYYAQSCRPANRISNIPTCWYDDPDLGFRAALVRQPSKFFYGVPQEPRRARRGTT